jgi:cytosine/adenosine deaminase-related metal-dependent hydrolase
VASLIIEADWILPVESPAIRGGFLVAQDGLIRYVGNQLPEIYENLPRVRLRDGAILPGLINTHCHLELSDIDRPLEVPSREHVKGEVGSMVGWLSQIMARRKATAELGLDIAKIKRRAIELGIREAWGTGTRLVVDNVTAPWLAQWNRSSAMDVCQTSSSESWRTLVGDLPIYIKSCIELVDVTHSRQEQTWDFALGRIQEELDSQDASWPPMGLAPHAPYTASKQIVAKAAEVCRQTHRLLSMHLAESIEEIEYAEERQGAFRAWISPWIDSEHARHIGTIDEYLELLCGTHRALIAHGNYLCDRQIGSLSRYRDRIAIVYCPRTHRHFRHAEHPAGRLRNVGVRVFLGTDSRGSNPDLSLFEEWKTACGSFPDQSPKYWMSACTTEPARFLEIENTIGTIRVGSKSLMTWVPLGDSQLGSEDQVWQAMLASEQAVPLEQQVLVSELEVK